MSLSLTLVIIAVTAITSYAAFSNQKLVNDLIFYPPSITEDKQWYRFVTCGFIHADMQHLLFNMLSLYFFGRNVETAFTDIFQEKGKGFYLLLYITALIVCLIPTFIKQRNNSNYSSLGASGAVSAVVFAGILLFPTAKIGIFILPPIIPAYIFAPIYLVISFYLDRKNSDNINHSAHIWGALYGIIFLLITSKFLSNFDAVYNFVENIKLSFQ